MYSQDRLTRNSPRSLVSAARHCSAPDRIRLARRGSDKIHLIQTSSVGRASSTCVRVIFVFPFVRRTRLRRKTNADVSSECESLRFTTRRSLRHKSRGPTLRPTDEEGPARRGHCTRYTAISGDNLPSGACDALPNPGKCRARSKVYT